MTLLLAAAADGGDSEGLYALALIVGGILFAVFVPYVLRRLKRQEAPSSKPVRERWEEHKTEREVRRHADSVLVELVETSREISGRMDTKIRILNTLIRDAERCIQRLEALQGRPPSGGPAPAAEPAEEKPPPEEAAPEESAAAPSPAPPAEPAPEPTDAAAGQAPRAAPEPPEEAALAGAADPDEAQPAGNAAAEEEDLWGGDTAQEVAHLHETGYSTPEIARQLGLSRQEVSLILHLQRQSGAGQPQRRNL